MANEHAACIQMAYKMVYGRVAQYLHHEAHCIKNKDAYILTGRTVRLGVCQCCMRSFLNLFGKYVTQSTFKQLKTTKSKAKQRARHTCKRTLCRRVSFL
eukprot:1146684-Pelagomonas_calceolata.AAC.3